MGQCFLSMWTITISLILLVASSSNGGVVDHRRRRSIKDKPYNGAKDLLSMKDASAAIRRSFNEAGKELEDLAKKLEEEVDTVARLSAYINGTQTRQISDTLAEALNIQSVSIKPIYEYCF